MSTNPGQRASELAARQVEQIVSAAQAAAVQIRKDAEAESREMSAAARRERQEVIEKVRRDAQAELTEARKQAILLGQDARRDAEALVDDAEEEAAQIRDKTRRAVEGRVAAAERAAAEVLDEARALSGGLRQLGKALEAHADRILRDVTAAHKRMQADLRLESGSAIEAPLAAAAAAPARSDRAADGGYRSGSRRAETLTGEEPPESEDEAPARPKRRNPFEEIELPSWVGRER